MCLCSEQNASVRFFCIFYIKVLKLIQNIYLSCILTYMKKFSGQKCNSIVYEILNGQQRSVSLQKFKFKNHLKGYKNIIKTAFIFSTFHYTDAKWQCTTLFHSNIALKKKIQFRISQVAQNFLRKDIKILFKEY